MDTYREGLSTAGIAYVDFNGQQLDFHAFWGTFATRLLREGVPPSIARRLTRHASVKTLEKHDDKLDFSGAEQELR